MTARDVVLERVRQAVARRTAGPRPAALRRRGRRRRDELVVEAFVERVRDYRATVVHATMRRSPRPRCCATQGARRIGIAPDLDARLRPAGVELVEDDALSPQQLDELDGALTTCAAACAITGTIALDGGPGQGRRALTLLPDLHVCVVREDQIVETVPELVRRLEACRSRGAAARPRLRAVGDVRHRARSGSRACTGRAGSS